MHRMWCFVHRVDVFFIALDALRIVLDVFCIVCDAWASFDACASHVELGAPWVTEASLLRGIFLFFLYFVAFDISLYSSFYLSGVRWIYHSLTHVGCWMAVWTFCAVP